MTKAEKITKAGQIVARSDARREQMMRELASDLADLVSSGDLTESAANEWLAAKADQWKEPA